MKKLIILALCTVFFSPAVMAQQKINIGAGYFGHTLTHPGSVLEIEWEHTFTERASLPLRINVGYYNHNRYNTVILADVHAGFRQYLTPGFFLEESIGAGIFQGILDSDAVYQVDESGTVTEGSRILPVDLMPSITLGMGYHLTKK